MLKRTLPTSLLQIFCKNILIFKVIGKNIKDPDEDFLFHLEFLVEEIFEGEMLKRTLPISLLQIFCKNIINFKIIGKNI